VNITYVGTADASGTVRVLRQEQSGDATTDSLMTLKPGLNRMFPDCSAQLALALLTDCLVDVARARRVQQALAYLLVSPLLLRSNWILTSEDIEGAVQEIELCAADSSTRPRLRSFLRLS